MQRSILFMCVKGLVCECYETQSTIGELNTSIFFPFFLKWINSKQEGVDNNKIELDLRSCL